MRHDVAVEPDKFLCCQKISTLLEYLMFSRRIQCNWSCTSSSTALGIVFLSAWVLPESILCVNSYDTYDKSFSGLEMIARWIFVKYFAIFSSTLIVIFVSSSSRAKRCCHSRKWHIVGRWRLWGHSARYFRQTVLCHVLRNVEHCSWAVGKLKRRYFASKRMKIEEVCKKNTYIHTYIHTYVYTYMHTYTHIHTYTGESEREKSIPLT